ncbi:MAG: hypothetical protein ACPKPY_07995 [Nitrososphaeraceae archaeon]
MVQIPEKVDLKKLIENLINILINTGTLDIEDVKTLFIISEKK